MDTRVLTSSFKAEKTLTKDTVPVDVDAVLFGKIVDPGKAALAVADYQAAIGWASLNRQCYSSRPAHDLKIEPRVPTFTLEDANGALLAVKDETENLSAVIIL